MELDMAHNFSQTRQKMAAAFAKTPPVVGVAMSAFDRILPAMFYPKYKIVCFRGGRDLDLMDGLVEVESLERDYRGRVACEKNTACFLNHGFASERLVKDKAAIMYVLRNNQVAEEWFSKNSLTTFSNRFKLQEELECKGNFLDVCKRLKIPIVPSVRIKVKELDRQSYAKIVGSLGPKLVFQMADVVTGGGHYTNFLFEESNFEELSKRMKDDCLAKGSEWLKVSSFIDGASICATACITGGGVVLGTIRKQVIGVKELCLEGKLDGVYCGNQWGAVDERVGRRVDDVLTKLGSYLSERGYKGIFGVDLMVDKKGRALTIECNPRYQGSSTLEGMMMEKAGLLSLDRFHFGEFLDVPTQRETVWQLNQATRETEFVGAQLILKNVADGSVAVGGSLRAGVYKYDEGGKLNFSRPGWSYAQLSLEDEILVTDGVPVRGQVIKKGQRVGRVLFKQTVLKRPGELNDFSRGVVEEVYRILGMRVIEEGQ